MPSPTIRTSSPPRLSRYIGPALVALTADAKVGAKAGQVLTSWDLAEEYELYDVNGTCPHWRRHFAEYVQSPPPGLSPKGVVQTHRQQDRPPVDPHHHET